MRERLLCGPPRAMAKRASSFSHHTELTMYGVQALAPVRRRVRGASIFAMFAWLPGVTDQFQVGRKKELDADGHKKHHWMEIHWRILHPKLSTWE
jgi:hypothetical protein